MPRKKTLEEFILDSEKVHGNKYDYSEVDYQGCNVKVKIFCREKDVFGVQHGYFFQTPSSHLIQKQGCPKCANNLKYTTDIFVAKAKQVHGDKYDYSKVDYINKSTKVEIVCHSKNELGVEHGTFLQTPNGHLLGRGCPICAREYISNKYKMSLQEFIDRSNAIHNFKYSYDKVNYVNSRTKVCITCPNHGDFFQTPECHTIQKQGCPKCGIEIAHKSTTKTLDEFIKQANEVHNNVYNYDKTKYVSAHKKVVITCPTHGDFFQTPHGHTRGDGCPSCSSDKILKTKKLNGTVCTSSLEEKLSLLLSNVHRVVLRNHDVDSRYPFPCDFYIPERDLFIELNAYWTHGGAWFDRRTKNTKEKMSIWTKKDGPQYKSAVETFSKRDPLKRQTAKKNNLNYVVLWNEQDIEDWFALGCPDGKDWDHEYSWKDANKEV